jgi:hypothetical protein
MTDAKNEISLNGLRYKSKKSGSPYEGMRMGFFVVTAVW